MMNLVDRTELIREYLYKLDDWLVGAGIAPLSAEQLDSVLDPARAGEGYAMLQDLEARVIGQGRVSHILARVYAGLCESMEEHVAHCADDMPALLNLMREWIGHADVMPTDTAETVAKLLNEWIQALWESSDCHI